MKPNPIKMEKIWAEIDKSAIFHNVSVFYELIGKRILMAVVKSNAYGHGLCEVANIISQKQKNRKNFLWFAVDNIDEALALRKNGIKNKILVLGYTLNSRLKEASEHKISLAVYNKETIIAAEKYLKKQQKLDIHIKVETGTSRQGVFKKDILEFARFASKNKNINIEGIYTHYADAENPKSDFFWKQLKEFKSAIGILEKNNIFIPIKHASCTAAAMFHPETYFDAVRVGIGIYGLYPSSFFRLKFQKTEFFLKPALKLKVKIAQVKNIKKGTAVSYDMTEKVKKNSQIAVLPVGYFDGFGRGLSRKGEVLIKGKKCKILGVVCMNMTMVDTSGIKGIKPEDEAVLIGRQNNEMISVEDVAEKLNTINYEVIAGINSGIKRIFV